MVMQNMPLLTYLRNRLRTQCSYKYVVDEENKLVRLFMADVLVFDTTYRSSAYRKPLVVFARVDNHFMTCVYAYALLWDESEETYKGALQTLLEAMCNKKPCFVVIEGDAAMRNTIKDIFPSSRHHLCGWQLMHNASINVKCKEFRGGCTTKKMMTNKFEAEWSRVATGYRLQRHAWVQKMYRSRIYGRGISEG